MSESITIALLFLQNYILPAAFAIGVIFFIYGFVNSFMVDRPEVGHPSIVNSFAIFAATLIAYGAVLFFMWVIAFSATLSSEDLRDGSGIDAGADIDRGNSFLQVPDVPRAND